MTVQQIKKDINNLKQAIKPDEDRGQIVICDRSIWGDSGKGSLESIIKINGLDVSNCTIDEKKKDLSKSHFHCYLPKKRPTFTKYTSD